MPNEVAIVTTKMQSQKNNCCCNCCYCCDCCECCHCGQCIDCDDCCGCKCFCCIFSKILIGLTLFFIDAFTLLFRLLAAVCIGCELFPFSRLFLNSDWIGCKVPRNCNILKSSLKILHLTTFLSFVIIEAVISY